MDSETPTKKQRLIDAREMKKHHELVYRTVVGLLGGMGPEATLDLFSRVLRTQHRQFVVLQRAVQQGANRAEQLTAVKSVSTAPWTLEEVRRLSEFPGDIATARWDDQHHIPILVFNSTQIPDRTAYLLAPDDASAHDPRPALQRTARSLVAAGANLLAMPCNTAHAFAPDIEAAVGTDAEVRV